jgi:hypothetical protein
VILAKNDERGFGSLPKTYIRATMDHVLSPALKEEIISMSNVDQILVLESGRFIYDKCLVDVLDQAVTQE